MKTNELRPQEPETKLPFYKTTLFPWMILISLALLGAGLIGGWTLRTNTDSIVRSEASNMLTSLSKPRK